MNSHTRPAISPAMRLGQDVRKYRRQMRLSRRVVADLTSIDLNTIKAVEAGNGMMSSLTTIADALELTLIAKHAPKTDLVDGLVSLRKQQGFSVRALANRLEVARNTLIKIEAGDDTRIHNFALYAAALGAGLTILPAQQAQKSFYTGVGNESGYHGWQTPPEIFVALEKVIGRFDLDPCAPSDVAAAHAKTVFTPKTNGLRQPWWGQVFMNPPYGREIKLWLEKASSEATAGVQIVGLVPARTDTAWWHNFVVGQADVVFLRGRLAFGDGTQAAPFPSALIFWGYEPEIATMMAANLGGNVMYGTSSTVHHRV
ncbi:MAG: helix-turn-helix domain-containing protein [Shimia sp.]|nr:helix-turn-helix domain-containing protein [Shimia sp.]